MFKLDHSLLTELGLGDLDSAVMNKILATMYEQLEMRVGMTLASKMTNSQLDEFEEFIQSDDQKGALSWLEANVPDYKEVVGVALDDLKAEIVDNRIEVRRVAIATTPPEMEELVERALGRADPALARDLFVFIGGPSEVCAASHDDRMSVPGMSAAMERKIRDECHGRRTEPKSASAPEPPVSIPPRIRDELVEVFGSVEAALTADDNELLRVAGVGPRRLNQIRELRRQSLEVSNDE